jgi:hypothetical protein
MSLVRSGYNIVSVQNIKKVLSENQAPKEAPQNTPKPIAEPEQIVEHKALSEDLPALPDLIKNLYVSFSPGTDVGKTFLASNMATWFATSGKKTILLDMDMGGSGTWEMIHMREFYGAPQFTLADWDGSREEILRMASKSAHPKIARLHVMIRGNISEPNKIMLAIYYLSQEYDVVVDTSNNLHDMPYIQPLIKTAERVFLIGRLILKVQTRISEMFNTANRVIDKNKMILVINRVGQQADEKIHPIDMARQFGFRKHYLIHEDYKARIAALKKRTMPVLVKSKVADELKTVLQETFPDFPESKSKKQVSGFLSLFKTRRF